VSTFRVVWTFYENTGSTFNEVFYTEATDAATAAKTSKGLLTARLSLLHPLNTLQVIRSSQVDKNRVTGQFNVNLNGTATTQGSTPVGPATPGDAMVFALAATPTGSRKLWMRGAPDDYIQRDPLSGKDVQNALLPPLFTAYFKALQAEGYGIRVLTPQNSAPTTNIKIVKVDGLALDGTSKVTLAIAPGYGFPSRVIIGGANKKELAGLNGRWSLVDAPVLNVIRIPYQTSQGYVINGGNAHCRQELYGPTNVFSAAACSFSYFGTRTTKNPITRSRGARRAARIRTLA
jgi:hypothetical protein